MKRSDELKRQRAELIADCEAMHASAGDKPLPADQQKKFDSNISRSNLLDLQIKDAIDEENSVAAHRARFTGGPAPTPVFDRSGGGGYTDTSHIPGSPLYGNQPRIVLPTLQAFTGPEAARDAYDCGLWLRGRVGGDSDAMRQLEARRGTTWLATQTETSPERGGYLVPPEFRRAVMVSREDTAAFRRLARIVPMGSDNLQYPKQTSGTTVFYPGEEGEITASDLDFGRIGLVTKKRAIYALVSNEVRDDAMVSIMDLLAQDMGHQFALKEDSEGITGDGSSTYGGVLGILDALTAATASVQSAATGHDTWPELDYGDFGLLMAKLPAKYRVSRNLKWLCSPAFKWGVMDRLALAQGGALAQTIVDGQPKMVFLGYEVVLSDDMPSTTATATICVAFGNFDRAVLLGERSEVRIATSEHIAFQTDQTAVRGTVRYDINVHEAGDTTNAGAIVALKTAS